jgi:DNA-directed RNA polymerase specialized sigma24 family protein
VEVTTDSIDEEATLLIVEEETPGKAAVASEEASKEVSEEEIEAALEAASVEATEVVALEEVEAGSVEDATTRTMMSPTGILLMTIKCARVQPFSQPPKEVAL